MTTVINTIIYIILALIITYLGRKLYQRTERARTRRQMEHVYMNISHELLTPLTVIAASIEQLREQEPTHSKDYALMDLNVIRMTRLLQQILEASKSQSGQLKLKVTQGDVIEFIRQTAFCIEPLMHKKGLTFLVHCEPESMMGWIDTDKVDKIIYNLLSNAAKYARTPGTVQLKVTMSKDFDQVIIKVTDNGVGIPADRIKDLFNRYYDGDHRWKKVHATGLGLALTRDLVFLHNGDIDCQSIKDQSTTFTVTLPIRKEDYAPEQVDEEKTIDMAKPQHTIIDMEDIDYLVKPETMTDRAENENLYRILIVEDNEELLMLMGSLLCNHFCVLTANNCETALRMIAKEPLDLIVSDVEMPDMDGNELTRKIKSTKALSHLPVILISSKTSEDDRKTSMLAGADDYITKPFRLSDLKLRINNIIENRIRIVGERTPATKENEQRPLSADEEFLQRARDCAKKHMNDADFDREAFAREMGASESTLYNKLRAMTGMNVTNFIQDIRMKEAMRQIESQPNLRVSDLAYMVGFRDPKYFATCFKKKFGTQPSELIASRQRT